MAHLHLRAVQKAYNSVQVIHGADIEILDGEFVVLVGPSGCGKSTLLRMIAGLEEVTAGDVEIDGQRVNHIPASDRGLAMVFQSYALYPHMTVYQNMAFGLENTRMPKPEIDSRVRRAGEMLRITELLQRKPKQLSGGQRQRVAIGRAIVRDPKIFLFDEPLSNLDAELRVAMRRELAALHHEIGGTMIYVTHDQIEAMTLANRIVVLNRGRVEQIGAPLELYNRPANLFVAGFIGSPRMNLLEGTVVETDADHTLLRLPGDRTWTLPFGLDVAPGISVTIGARPQHIATGAPGTGDIDVVVDLSEQLGGETYFYATPPGPGGLPQMTVHELGQHTVARGQTLSLRFHPEQVHVFAADGGILRHGPGHA